MNKNLIRNIIILLVFQIATWLIGTNVYYANSTTEDNNKTKTVSLYPKAVLSVRNCERIENKYFTLHEDPQIYISPPKYKILSTMIEFTEPIPIDSSVKIYYAKKQENLSEENSVLKLVPKGSSEVIIDLPSDIFSTLRYDIDIFGEWYEIKGIYVLKYVNNTLYITLIISICILVLWILVIRTGMMSIFHERITNMILLKKENKTSNDIRKMIKKRDIIVLCIFILLTWIIGLCNFCFSISSFIMNEIFDFKKEGSISLYPDSVLSIQNYELIDNQFYTLHGDPQIYILPPEQKIASTMIEFERPVSVKANVQLYYAKEGEPLSEENSAFGFFSVNSSKVAVNLPKDTFTLLRYDINIIGEKFEIKGIYVSETPVEINYIRSWIGNYDGILMTIIINFFIVLLWLLCIKTGYIDKIILNFARTIQYIKNIRKINILILITIIVFAVLIESIFSSLSNNNFNIYRVYLYIFIGLVIFFLIVLRNHPEKIFLLISLLIGILYIISFPPYLRITWDEDIHYNKAIEQSFIKEIKKIKSDYIYDVDQFAAYTNINLFNKESRMEYLSDINSKSNQMIIKQYNKNYSSLYRNIGYIPAAIMIFIGRSLSLPGNIIFSLGRIGIHLLYTLIVYFALKRLNSGKYIMIVIALLPTAFFQSVTYTYDYWTIAFLMLGYAYFFHEIQNPEKKIKIKYLIIMIGSFILGLGPKAIYFPLMLILYFLPKEKFNNKTSYNIYLFTVTFFIIFVVMSFVLPLITTNGEEFSDMRGGSDVSAVEQIQFILQNPKTYTIILLKFIKNYLNIFNGQTYTTSFAYLGQIPYHNLILFLLGFVVITDKNQKDVFSSNAKYRIIISTLVLTTVVLIATALYVAFTSVGSLVILGVQGRYLLPLLFPFFYILGSSKIQNNMNKYLYSSIIFGIMSFILLSGIWTVCISKYN